MPEKELQTAEKGDSTICHKHKSWIIGASVAIVLLAILALGAVAARRLIFRFNRLDKMNAFRENTGEFGPRMDMRSGFAGYRLSIGDSVTAKVTAVNNKQVTIDLNGNSKIVQINDSTRFPLSSTTNIKVGDTLAIRGGQDSSGVIQADMIVVNPDTTNLF